MYNKGDLSFKYQPKFLAKDTIDAFLKCLDVYLCNHTSNTFNFVFHGGEPLLAPFEIYEYFITSVVVIFKKHSIKPTFGIQTNGVLINKNWIDFLKKHEIYVGFSLDTTKTSNDNNRIFHSGKSSYNQIVRGFNLYKKYMGYTPGILSVIDINQLPEEIFAHYKNINATVVNLLFPDDTYDSNYKDDLTFGKWLLSMYDLWLKNNTIQIEQFELLTSLFYGVSNIGDEYYGVVDNNTFVLETDGGILANDPLRVCHPNDNKTLLNVKYNNINDLKSDSLADYYYNNKHRLSKKCSNCQLSKVCSGGYLINRFSKKNGFDNPSIYCKSLAYFIVNVQHIIANYTNPNMTDDKKITKIDLNEVLKYCENKTYEETKELSKFKH